MTETRLKWKDSELVIRPNDPTIFIGERCNALGYKSVKEALEADNHQLIIDRAIAQAEAGASIINVNMVGTSKAEEELLPLMVEKISAAVDVPLSLDFGSIEALEAALKIVPGQVLINSVNGEEQKLNPTLELAKKYNAAVIALACDESGIPRTAAERIAVVQKILDRAATFGLTVNDLIIDAVCLGIGTDPEAGPTTFETCRLVRSEFNSNIILGAGNAAFGMPKRRTLNATYLALAIEAGMNVALSDITHPELKWAARSTDACLGRDEYAARYIQTFREEKEKAEKTETVTA